jgi:hypothetical protein
MCIIYKNIDLSTVVDKVVDKMCNPDIILLYLYILPRILL